MTPDPSEAPKPSSLPDAAQSNAPGGPQGSRGILVMGQGSSGGGFVRRRLSVEKQKKTPQGREQDDAAILGGRDMETQ